MDEWDTPQWLVDQLADEFGAFDLDPAATDDNHKAPIWYTLADNGLAHPWFGKVWMNCPYSALGKWLKKARAEVEAGNAELVVCLVPASTGVAWWREHTPSASLIRFWPGRLTFGAAKHSATFDSAVVVFGSLTGKHGTVPKRCDYWKCKRVFFPAQRNRITCSERCRKARSRELEKLNNPAKYEARLAARREARTDRLFCCGHVLSHG